MQKLDGTNIQQKILNHKNTFKATSMTVLHGLSFQVLQKNAKIRKYLKESYIAFRKSDLDKQKGFEGLVLLRNGVSSDSN